MRVNLNLKVGNEMEVGNGRGGGRGEDRLAKRRNWAVSEKRVPTDSLG